LHAARKVFSNVKTTLAKEWSPLANETLNPIKPDDVYRIDFNRLNELEKKQILFRYGINIVFLIHLMMRKFS
jgi:hypothetical protein